jgi:hypothetical protein
MGKGGVYLHWVCLSNSGFLYYTIYIALGSRRYVNWIESGEKCYASDFSRGFKTPISRRRKLITYMTSLCFQLFYRDAFSSLSCLTVCFYYTLLLISRIFGLTIPFAPFHHVKFNSPSLCRKTIRCPSISVRSRKSQSMIKRKQPQQHRNRKARRRTSWR